MTIKQQGGIFGRNPTFNDLTVEGTLTTSGAQSVDELNVDNINIDGNTISSTNTNGNVLVDPNGTGHAHVLGSKGLTWTDYGATTAMTIIGTQAGNTTSSSMFVNTPSVNVNYGSGFAVDGVYGSGSATRSTINLYALGTKNPGYSSRMTFYTTSASSLVECGSFTNAGNLAFPSGKGIDFSATSGTGISELFSDYEEGYWTPTVDSGTCVKVYGSYIKVGKMVHATFKIQDLSDTTTASAINVSLPFTAGSFSSSQWLGSWLIRRYDVSTSVAGVMRVQGSGTTMDFRYSDSTVGSEPKSVNYDDLTSGTNEYLSGSITYFAAS